MSGKGFFYPLIDFENIAFNSSLSGRPTFGANSPPHRIPRRRSKSPKISQRSRSVRGSKSPRRRSNSPPKQSTSLQRRSKSPRQKSPKRKSKSPSKRSKSSRRRSKSPSKKSKGGPSKSSVSQRSKSPKAQAKLRDSELSSIPGDDKVKILREKSLKEKPQKDKPASSGTSKERAKETKKFSSLKPKEAREPKKEIQKPDLGTEHSSPLEKMETEKKGTEKVSSEEESATLKDPVKDTKDSNLLGNPENQSTVPESLHEQGDTFLNFFSREF